MMIDRFFQTIMSAQRAQRRRKMEGPVSRLGADLQESNSYATR
jgi:hypothetical protein